MMTYMPLTWNSLANILSTGLSSVATAAACAFSTNCLSPSFVSGFDLRTQQDFHRVDSFVLLTSMKPSQ